MERATANANGTTRSARRNVRRRRSFAWQVKRFVRSLSPEGRRRLFGGAVALVAAVVVFGGMIAWGVQAALHENYSDQYETVTIEGEFTLVVKGGTNVRTEPLAALHHVISGVPAPLNEYHSVDTEGVNNCLGKVSDKNETGAVFHLTRVVKVTKSWFDDCHWGDDWNGPYIGIRISDLSKEELKLLPGKVAKDEDGIVWISSKYADLFEN